MWPVAEGDGVGSAPGSLAAREFGIRRSVAVPMPADSSYPLPNDPGRRREMLVLAAGSLSISIATVPQM